MDTPKTRILVVDDEPAFTSMLRLNLEKTGQFAVREENDPTRAVKKRTKTSTRLGHPSPWPARPPSR